MTQTLKPGCRPRTHSFRGESDVTQCSVNTELISRFAEHSQTLGCLQLCKAHHDKYILLHPWPIRGLQCGPMRGLQCSQCSHDSCYSSQEQGVVIRKELCIPAVVVVAAVVRARAYHQSPGPGSGTTPARRRTTVWEHFINRQDLPE